MGSLSAGVLLKLVEEMDADRNTSDETRKPVLLQIRSIIPILKDGNLWPNQGFYLRVADLTHAIYASLPNDQRDMILNDKLRLGQYIYVERLERACPVPVLIGLTPIPGRHFCVGKPKDLLSNNFLQYTENYDSDSESNNVAVEKKARENNRSKYSRKERKRDPGSLEDDTSDSDCSSLSTTSSVSKVGRRNWKSSDLSTIKEITETTVTKHKMKSLVAGHNTSGSPRHYAKYSSFDEKYCAKLERKTSDPNPRRLAKSPTKSDIISNKHLASIQSMAESKFIPRKDKAGEDEDICWDSMSPTLSKLGKEVLRQRDLALLTAAEALQEAAAAERLLKSLSTMLDFKSTSLDTSQQLVDSFLKHQENLAQTRLIIQSLTDPSAASGDGNSKNNNKSSVKEVYEREKQATEWAKAAVASDLSTVSLPSQPSIITSSDVTPTTTTTSPPKPSPKQKFPSLFRRSRKNSSVTKADSYTDNHQDDSTKGRRFVLSASTSLANSLETECRKRFLSYIEKYMDSIKSGRHDRQTVSIMNQLKRVNDWLDTITRNQPENNSNNRQNVNQRELETWELHACGRVRNKIIMFLLNHVTRSAALASTASDTPQT